VSQPVINKTYAFEGTLIGLEFNETIYLDSNWSYEDWNLKIEGPMSPYSLEWVFISEAILEIPM
jgi:hypothetical protein